MRLAPSKAAIVCNKTSYVIYARSSLSAGNVWASNNWQEPSSCYDKPEEGVSTRCGGQGMIVFYGMAKPVRAPQIGPARAY